MKACLITGADGYLGGRLVRTVLERSEQSVIAWVRSASAEEFEKKKAALSSRLGELALSPRLSFATGDLRDAEPFRSVEAASVGTIVHSASVTRFNVEKDLANDVNLGGAIKVFEFAEKCASLAKMIYVSTVYASGMREGEIREAPLEETQFANFYEWSKWQSEKALLSRFSHLPWAIARVATVISDNDEGQVTQYNVVHNTLKLLYYGLISLVPGRGDVPLYFVTGDFVTEALTEMTLRDVPLQRVYHLVHQREESLTLDQLLDEVFKVYDADEAFAARRVLRPLLCDQESFEILATQMDKFSGGVVQQAMQSIQPFARQLYVPKIFRNERSAAALSCFRAPEPASLARNTTRALIASRWGRK